MISKGCKGYATALTGPHEQMLPKVSKAALTNDLPSAI
jgi:hypothetical protein